MFDMHRTVAIKVEVPDGFLDYLNTCAVIFNRHVEWCFSNKSTNKVSAHKGIYHDLRQEFPDIPSAVIQSVRDMACEAVAKDKFKFKPIKKPGSAVRYNKNTFSLRGNLLTFSWSGKRIRQLIKLPHFFKKYEGWKCRSANIGYSKQHKCVMAYLCFEAPDVLLVASTRAVGIDRGLYNLITLSDGTIYSANKIRKKKRQFLFVKRQLQAQGTKSATRKLQRRSGQEKRFSLNMDHTISKWLANLPYDVFVLEDLKGISNKNRGKKLNTWLHNWTFFQLEQFLTYKAAELGKQVVKVDARYTSQKCSCCGVIDKTNRCESKYCCSACGYQEHADVNAAINILHNYHLSLIASQNKQQYKEQAVVNQPNVGAEAVLLTSHQPCADGN